MKVNTPEISWHAKDPIYSVDFQYLSGDIYRLATCGTDRNIRMWQVVDRPDGQGDVEFLSNLSRHTRTVNVVRFSPNGQVLASAGDDSAIMLWKRNDLVNGTTNIFLEEDAENKETWSVYKVLRSHLEDVYDLSWSADGKHLISGSVDNTAILWDAKKGHKLWIFTDHKSFVQGVAFDPLEQYMATMSCDRICRIYQFKSRTLSQSISKLTIPNTNNNLDEKPKPFKMFLDDALKSFFRRLAFSPDGNLLVVPAGCLEKGQGDKNTNVTYVFRRTNFSKPVLYLGGSEKASLAVRFSPILYKLRAPPTKSSVSNGAEDEASDEKHDSLFGLPYRMVYAVVTEDSVLLYDTQQEMPFAFVGNIHYHQLSDLTWSHDAKFLVISSTDGYCSVITFSEGELGTPYEEQVVKVKSKKDILNEIEERNKSELIKSKKPAAKVEAMDTCQAASAKIDSDTNKMDCEDISSSQQKSQNKSDKKPRRIQVTTLCNSQSESVSVNNSPKTDKPARRVQVTTLSTPTKGETTKTLVDLTNSTPKASTSQNEKRKSSASDSTPIASKDTTPRRVQLKTLSPFPSKNSPGPSTDEDVSFHLVLEETNDVSQLAEKKPSIGASETEDSKCTPSKECKAEGLVTPTTRKEGKTPRRIQPVLLQSPSTSHATSPKPSTSKQMG